MTLPFNIGVATISYDEQGNPTSQTFKPGENIEPDDNLLNQLKQIPTATDSELVKQNADLVLAGWWSKMNEAELADRDEFKIYSEIVECLKYDNGSVKSCSIEYTFKKRTDEVNAPEMVN